MANKDGQTIYERAEIAEKAMHKLSKQLKGKSTEIIGHLESAAYCCRNGTVAVVKVDLDQKD